MSSFSDGSRVVNRPPFITVSALIETWPIAGTFTISRGSKRAAEGAVVELNGQALARNEDALERLAERLSVQPLLEFFSADRNSMALLLDQGAGDPEWTYHLPQPQWFRC